MLHPAEWHLIQPFKHQMPLGFFESQFAELFPFQVLFYFSFYLFKPVFPVVNNPARESRQLLDVGGAFLQTEGGISRLSLKRSSPALAAGGDAE